MLDSQGLFDEAVRVYKLVSVQSKAEVQAIHQGGSPDEADDSDPVEVVDLKRSRGLILQKLGKIYQNELYKAHDAEMAI